MSLNNQNIYLTGKRLVGQSKDESFILDGHEVSMVYLDLGAAYNCPELADYIINMLGAYPEELTGYDLQQILDEVQAGNVKASPQAQDLLQTALAWVNSDVVEDGQSNNHIVLFNTYKKY